MIILRFPSMTHFRVRALEWQIAGISLMAAFLLLLPGYSTLDNPAFVSMRQWGGDNFWAAILGSVGIIRALALWRNGAWYPSPWIRMITAAISASIWGIVCFNLLSDMKAYLMLAPFLVMVFSDIYSVGRASSDARLSRDERLQQPEAPRVLSTQ